MYTIDNNWIAYSVLVNTKEEEEITSDLIEIELILALYEQFPVAIQASDALFYNKTRL